MNVTKSIFRTTSTAVVVLFLAAHVEAIPISMDIDCGGETVGVVAVDVYKSGIIGLFGSNDTDSLAEVAAQCGEHHFNWYQIVTATNFDGYTANGNPLTVPFVDPPPGQQVNSSVWEDTIPWYWSEDTPPPGSNVAPGESLSEQTTNTRLNFIDFPGGPSGRTVSFKTWLVSLDKYSALHAFHEGFSWDFTQYGDDTSGVSNIKELGAGVIPTNAEYANIIGNFQTQIPEPSTLYLAILGGLSILVRCRRRV